MGFLLHYRPRNGHGRGACVPLGRKERTGGGESTVAITAAAVTTTAAATTTTTAAATTNRLKEVGSKGSGGNNNSRSNCQPAQGGGQRWQRWRSPQTLQQIHSESRLWKTSPLGQMARPKNGPLQAFRQREALRTDYGWSL